MKSFFVAAVLLTTAATEAAADGFPGNASAGAKVYSQTCVVCHGADGTGNIPGVPDLTGKKSPLATRSHKVLLDHTLNGFQDSHSSLSMPPKGGNENLTIRDIQNVLKYMHEKFGYRLENGAKSR